MVKNRLKAKRSRTGRKRKVLGAAFVMLGVALAALWFWSGGRSLWFGYGTFDLRINAGEARIAWGRPMMKSLSWDAGESSAMGAPTWRTWRGWGEELMLPQSRLHYGVASVCFTSGTPWGVLVLFWPVPFLLAVVGATLLRSGISARRLALGDKCVSCGYDLAGLADEAKCPECGKAKL